jgi:hypothetical protein
MKEAYAVRRTVPPSAEIQAEIDKLLGKGMVEDPQKMLSELARLGARLIIQRAVEDEFDTWLGRIDGAQVIVSGHKHIRGGGACDRDQIVVVTCASAACWRRISATSASRSTLTLSRVAMTKPYPWPGTGCSFVRDSRSAYEARSCQRN